MQKVNRKIANGVYIKKAVTTTKLCPFCGTKIYKGMFHVTFSDMHKTEPRSAKPYIYSSNTIRVHIECFGAMSKQVNNVIRTMKTDIKNNRLMVGAQQI